ncbi:MAG: MFS transporter, partial [Elusimicrobiaceae bacterium]|nr:MFS transporter [Elusimicrobiaceae bacterium]
LPQHHGQEAQFPFQREYWHLYVGAVLLGIGFAWTTTTIVGNIVEKWFTNGKGTIMGIILAANGLGGALSEVIIDPMCNSEGGLGWRAAYKITAVIFLVIGVLAFVLIRNTPAEMGIEPLGRDAVAKKKRGADWVGFEMKEILKKPYFYVCGACIFLTGMILQSMNGLSKIQIYSVVGKSDEMVAWVSTVFVAHSLVLMVSKILAGSSFDKFGIRFTFAYCSIFAIISLLALVLIEKTGMNWFAWVYSVCSSIALPLETIMIPLLVSEVFGKKCHANIMGYYLGLNVFGYACGGPIADYFKQNVGTYNFILIVFCVVMAITALTIQFTFVAAKKDRVAFEKKLKESAE